MPKKPQPEEDGVDASLKQKAISSPNHETAVTSDRNPAVRGEDDYSVKDDNVLGRKRKRKATTCIQRTPNDILCGRGIPIQNYHGNIRLHRILDSHREEYLATSRRDKPDLIRRIIAKVKEGGARFLKRKDSAESSKDDPWEELDDSYAYEKVSHALRCRRYADNAVEDNEPVGCQAEPNQSVGALNAYLPLASQSRDIIIPDPFPHVRPTPSVCKVPLQQAKTEGDDSGGHSHPKSHQSLLEMERQFSRTFPHTGNNYPAGCGGRPGAMDLLAAPLNPPPTQRTRSNPIVGTGLMNPPLPFLHSSIPLNLLNHSPFIENMPTVVPTVVAGATTSRIQEHHRHLQADSSLNYSMNGSFQDMSTLNLQNHQARHHLQPHGAPTPSALMGGHTLNMQDLMQMQHDFAVASSFVRQSATSTHPLQSPSLTVPIGASLASSLPPIFDGAVATGTLPPPLYQAVLPGFWASAGSGQLQNMLIRDIARLRGHELTSRSDKPPDEDEGRNTDPPLPKDDVSRRRMD